MVSAAGSRTRTRGHETHTDAQTKGPDHTQTPRVTTLRTGYTVFSQKVQAKKRSVERRGGGGRTLTNETKEPSARIQPWCDIYHLLEGVIVAAYDDVIAASVLLPATDINSSRPGYC